MTDHQPYTLLFISMPLLRNLRNVGCDDYGRQHILRHVREMSAVSGRAEASLSLYCQGVASLYRRRRHGGES